MVKIFSRSSCVIVIDLSKHTIHSNSDAFVYLNLYYLSKRDAAGMLLLSKREALGLGEYDELALTYIEFQMLYGHPRGSEQELIDF